MPLDILVVGGTGEISTACVDLLYRQGHHVTVFNRGSTPVVDGVQHVHGDVSAVDCYTPLASRSFDVVCQFLAFEPDDIRRDLAFFAGRCDQYLFVSSASAYRKPWPGGLITEDTPLENPFMAYSRNKAACEVVLAEVAGRLGLPFTIVRPSHTYYKRLPSTVIDGVHLVWRIRSGQPVVVHDDGRSLWTLTHAEDFARAFAKLCGNTRAYGEAYHITDSEAYEWQTILRTIGELADKQVQLCSVPSDVLAGYEPAWRAPLLGDKANSVQFDNTKIATLTDGWHCQLSLRAGLARAFAHCEAALLDGYQPPAGTQHLIDTIVRENS